MAYIHDTLFINTKKGYSNIVNNTSCLTATLFVTRSCSGWRLRFEEPCCIIDPNRRTVKLAACIVPLTIYGASTICQCIKCT